jgi:hypothetical protein
MNKESVTQFATTCITLAVLFFTLEVFSGDVSLQFQNILPYLVSALIGTGVGTLYFKFVGFRFTKLQFIACVIPTILFSLLVTKFGLHHNWIVHDLTLTVAFMLVVFNSLELKRKSL